MYLAHSELNWSVMANYTTRCENSCSGHGECYDGICICEVRYSGGTCNDINFNYYISFATIFYAIFFISFVQLVLCMKSEYDKMKSPFFSTIFRITTQKTLYFVICVATLLRGIYFSSPKPDEVIWAYSLLSAYYPILLTGSSLIVCFWAEVFHLKDISFDRHSFLSKSLVGYILFNVITYSLLLAELLLLRFSAFSDVEKSKLLSICQGCYAILMLIVLVFFLIYGVEVYFKVKGEFSEGSSLTTDISQLHQSRIGLVSHAMLLLFMAMFISSESLGSLWKNRVPVLSRNCYDVVFRVIEMGVVLWFPCVLWNCTSPEQLWILNPRRLFQKLESPSFFRSAEEEALATACLEKPNSDLGKQNEVSLCWICYDSERQDYGPLLQPCKCKGDVSVVHHECLKKWLIRLSANPETACCKVCNEKYQLECHTKWIPKGITVSQWLIIVALIIIMLSVAAGACFIIHQFTNMGIRAFSAGSAILLEYICLRFLSLNILKGYQRGKISAVTILNRNNNCERPLMLQQMSEAQNDD